MTSLATRNSFLNDFFRDTAPSFFIKPLHRDQLPYHNQIKINVTEGASNYTVTAEIPGVKKEDIHVLVEDDVVTLRADIKQEDQSASTEKVLRSERYFGTVSRSFRMAENIDEWQSKAKYENGVLTLTLPKKAVVDTSKRLTIE